MKKTSTVYGPDEHKKGSAINSHDYVTSRLRPLSVDRLAAVETILSCIPLPLQGKQDREVQALLFCYGHERGGNDKKPAQRLLQETLPDWDVVVLENVKRADLRLLQIFPSSNGKMVKLWINDELVNGHAALVKARCDDLGLGVRFFSSYFYEKLKTDVYEYNKKSTRLEMNARRMSLFHYQR